MKNLYTFVIAILLTANIFAQAPEKMSYQAVVRDLSDALVTSQAVGMRISILQGSITGTSIYAEIYNPNPLTNANGLVTVSIGEGIPLLGTFSTIDWTNGPYFIKTETDPSGGTAYNITGTSQLLSVPYALYSKTAENVINDVVDDADADPTNEIELPATANTNEMLMWNGFEWVAGDVCSLFSFSYADSDGDSFGDPYNIVFACGLPTGFVVDNTDCDDTNSNNYPTAPEVCDGIDNNCDGQIDEGLSTITQYIDNDGDGFGDNSDSGSQVCVLQSGFSLNNGDCDDGDPGTNSGASEICNNGIDDDCNGDTDLTDEGCIGYPHQGGIIFYLDGSGGGLIATTTNQSTSSEWGCETINILGANGLSVGTGSANTIAIEAGCTTAGTAADICANLSLAGYSDWFLPSKDELNLMYMNIGQGNALGLGNLGGFASADYWSSSAQLISMAWKQEFNGGSQFQINKNDTGHVRAVRAF